MLDYKKTEDMERMKAEAVKRLKWPKIPGLNEAFAKGIVMVSDGTNGDVKLRNLTIYEKYMVTNFEKIQHAIVYHTILTETKFGKMLSMLFVGKYEDEWFWMRKILNTGICRKSGLSRLFRNWHYWYRMYRKWNHTYLLILHNKRREQTFWLLFFMFFRQSHTLLTE